MTRMTSDPAIHPAASALPAAPSLLYPLPVSLAYLSVFLRTAAFPLSQFISRHMPGHPAVAAPLRSHLTPAESMLQLPHCSVEKQA